MTPTPQQLINRRLLAQDARKQLALQKFYPTEIAYIRKSGRTCMMCAVGAVVASGVALEYPEIPRMDVIEGAKKLSTEHDLPDHIDEKADYHILLMHLTGLTLEEIVAFEAAFMGFTVYVGHAPQYWFIKVAPDLWKVPLNSAGFDEWASTSPLIRSALDWRYFTGKSKQLDNPLEARTQRMMDLLNLLESWETQPVSFPLPTPSKET